MPSHKIDIDADLVNAAVAEAKAGVDGIKDYVDISQPYLVLRLKRRGIAWLVKTRATTKTLGRPPELGVRRARRLAEDEITNLRKAPAQTAEAAPDEPPPGWTWGELRTRYIAHLDNPRVVNGRVRVQSQNTIDDAKLSLGRSVFADWENRQIRHLTIDDFTTAIQSLQNDVSQRQAEKAYSYTKAALSWALSTHTKASGLSVASPWWMALEMPATPQAEIDKMLERQRAQLNATLTVEQVGKVLAIHEDYCRGRVGRDKISPGVRWGLWWDALTACRRGAGTMIRRDAIIWQDPRAENGWGLASWSADLMKTRIDHALPIPPFGIHILESVMRDWKMAASKSHGARVETEYVFASTRRIGRKPDNRDVITAPDALSNHLSAMRGTRGTSHRDHLESLPYFTMHSFRDSIASYLLDRDDLPPGAASAMLAHAIKGDVDPRHEKMSPTTRQFYDFAQRIPLKTKAMVAWSEALLAAYKAAGGIYPD